MLHTDATVADEMTRERTPHVPEAFWQFALCCGRLTTRQIASLRLSVSLITFPSLLYDGSFPCNMFCDLLDLNEMDVFFFLNLFNANDFNGNTVFHSWPTELRCSVKNPTLVDASLAALNITHTNSGVVRCQVISALSAPCSRWQFSGVETFKCVFNEREVSLMLTLQMCWCVLWDQWNGLVIFNQMSWQIYSTPLRGWLTLWRGTLAPPRSR